MRLLKQMLNLRRIFDSFSRRFDKIYFIWNWRIWLIQTSHLKAVTSRIKLGTCENRRLSWVMITVSSITKNTRRYAMIHTAFFIFPWTLLSIYHIILLAICTTQVKKRWKRDLKKKTKETNKQKGYEKFASRGFEPGPSESVWTKS